MSLVHFIWVGLPCACALLHSSVPVDVAPVTVAGAIVHHESSSPSNDERELKESVKELLNLTMEQGREISELLLRQQQLEEDQPVAFAGKLKEVNALNGNEKSKKFVLRGSSHAAKHHVPPWHRTLQPTTPPMQPAGHGNIPPTASPAGEDQGMYSKFSNKHLEMQIFYYNHKKKIIAACAFVLFLCFIAGLFVAGIADDLWACVVFFWGFSFSGKIHCCGMFLFLIGGISVFWYLGIIQSYLKAACMIIFLGSAVMGLIGIVLREMFSAASKAAESARAAVTGIMDSVDDMLDYLGLSEPSSADDVSCWDGMKGKKPPPKPPKVPKGERADRPGGPRQSKPRAKPKKKGMCSTCGCMG